MSTTPGPSEHDPPLWFGSALSAYASAYPSAKLTPEQVRVYWRILRAVDRETLGKAMLAAGKESPQFFPGAFAVSQAADAIRRTVKQRAEYKPPPMPKDDRLLPYSIPTDPHWQREYIMEAANPFERLARRWEVENLASGKPVADMGARRARELNEMMEQHWPAAGAL